MGFRGKGQNSDFKLKILEAKVIVLTLNLRHEGKGQNSDFKLRLLRKKSDLKCKSINFTESHPLCTLGISFSSNQQQDKEQRGTRIRIACIST